jgi:hypothetical protein
VACRAPKAKNYCGSTLARSGTTFHDETEHKFSLLRCGDKTHWPGAGGAIGRARSAVEAWSEAGRLQLCGQRVHGRSSDWVTTCICMADCRLSASFMVLHKKFMFCSSAVYPMGTFNTMALVVGVAGSRTHLTHSGATTSANAPSIGERGVNCSSILYNKKKRFKLPA